MPENKDRLEREIDEILNKIEQFPAPENRRARARKRAVRRVGNAISLRQQAVARYLSRVSMSQVMLTSFLLILGAFFFRRFSPALTQWVLYAGIVLFISSFAIMVFSSRSGGRGGNPAYWRGREIQYRGNTAFHRLRVWYRSKRRTR